MVNSVRTGHSRRVISNFGPGTANGVVIDDIYRTRSETSTEAKTGTKNPNWRAQVRSHIQAGTPYSTSWLDLGMVTGHISGSYMTNTILGRSTSFIASGELFLDNLPPTPGVPDLSYLDVQARVKFLQKCRASQRQFQGGTFLGELREAIMMVKRPASSLRKGISAYLREVKKTSGRIRYTDRGKVWTKLWLEHNYGWRPLIHDIENGMEALKVVNPYVPDYIVSTAKDKFNLGSSVIGTLVSGIIVSAGARFTEVASGSVKYMGVVAWESENKAPSWNTRWGLTASDFIPTVYELIPYSFIVDYFSNIGAVIDAMSFGRVNLRWGVGSRKTQSDIRMSVVGPGFTTGLGHAAPESLTCNLSLSQRSRGTFVRFLPSVIDVSLQDIQFQIPGVGDWRKWANLSALAIDKFL